MVVFAFRKSVSEQSEHDIITVMTHINDTLELLKKDVSYLQQHWSASEADQYYSKIATFQEEALKVSSILQVIESKLKLSRHEVTEFRENTYRELYRY